MDRKLKIFFLVSTLTLLYACKEDHEPQFQSELYGQWLLVEYYSDPGDGSGTWQQPTSNSYQVISFRRDNVFKGDDGLYNILPGYVSFAVRSDSALVLFKNNHVDSLRMRYSFSDDILQINPPCIEGCGNRFRKITDY